MGKSKYNIPRAIKRSMSKAQLLQQLKEIDSNEESRQRVLRLETDFRNRIVSHIESLPKDSAEFKEFNTSPYVLLVQAKQKNYKRISEIEGDILPAKQFSSMETSAGRLIELVVLPIYGWEPVPSKMHTTDSALDGQKTLRLATLKSGPRCLNDEMSENLADAIVMNVRSWADRATRNQIDFTYGVLYSTQKASNKKDWHILRNIWEKRGDSIITKPDGNWHCSFQDGEINVSVTIRIGLDWWEHLGGRLCFIEVFTALIRACITSGDIDDNEYKYTIPDLRNIVSTAAIDPTYNVGLLQKSQIPWLFLMAKHFCDEITD